MGDAGHFFLDVKKFARPFTEPGGGVLGVDTLGSEGFADLLAALLNGVEGAGRLTAADLGMNPTVGELGVAVVCSTSNPDV